MLLPLSAIDIAYTFLVPIECIYATRLRSFFSSNTLYTLYTMLTGELLRRAVPALRVHRRHPVREGEEECGCVVCVVWVVWVVSILIYQENHTR